MPSIANLGICPYCRRLNRKYVRLTTAKPHDIAVFTHVVFRAADGGRTTGAGGRPAGARALIVNNVMAGPRRPGGGLPGRGGTHPINVTLAPALIAAYYRAGAAPGTAAIGAPERAAADGTCVAAGAVPFFVASAAHLIAPGTSAFRRAVKAGGRGGGRQAAAALRAGSFHACPTAGGYLRIHAAAAAAAAVQGRRPAQFEKEGGRDHM